METVKDLMGLVDDFQSSVEDEKMKNALAEIQEVEATNEQFFHILRGVLENLGAQGKRLKKHDKVLKSIKKRLRRLARGTASDTYTGPHPLSSVSIPSEEQQERIEALANRSRIRTAPMRQDPDQLVELEPVRPPRPVPLRGDVEKVRPIDVASSTDE